jgi:DoxX-like family
MLWTGRIISALPALVLLVDGAMKVGKPEVVVKTTVELGHAETVILPLWLVLLAWMALYLMPRTAVLGAILLTGYVGGAVATHVRAGQGPCEILFPVVLGALLWKGLVLRDDRLRTRMPLCH